MQFLKKNIILILILSLAIFLRFYKLDVYPALNADEAAIGYNAYSLILTGHDEHGNAWPIHFQSFNDYKPGLYFYLVLPFVKILGLNEWAVRIPGAALGVLTILFVYLLVNEIFGNKKFALISAFLLSISPWHLQFSRGGWEVNVATFFIVPGMFFFFRARSQRFVEKIFSLALSSVFLVASLYTYHAARVVVPLLGLGIVFFYKKEIFNKIIPYVVFAGITLILLVPLARDLTSPGALSRVAGVGLFADPGPRNRINEQRGEHGDLNNIFTKALHNKAVNYGLAFAANWASHYHGEFLFLSGDAIQRNKVPETGQMYLFDIIFLTIGVVAIAKRFNREWKFITYWLAIAPMASALTFQSPNALRSQNMIIPLIIFSAYGLYQILEWINKNPTRKLKVIYLSTVIILVSWNFARYEHMYWVHMSKEYPFSSQYGVKELVGYVNANQSKYKNVVVTDRYDQPYILFLFYSKYLPQNFQGSHSLTARDNFGFSTVRSFDKYRFVTFTTWDEIKAKYPESLVAGTTQEIPKEANIIKRIYGTNGYEYFDLVAN